MKNADADIKVFYILSRVYLPFEHWAVSVKTNYVCGISGLRLVKMRSSFMWDVMQRRLVVVTEISGGQVLQEDCSMTVEIWTDRFFRNIDNKVSI